MMVGSRLIVLAEAASDTGVGHYVRSSALAHELHNRGWSITVVHHSDVLQWAIEDSRAKGWEVLVSGWEPRLLEELATLSEATLIVDSYRVGTAWFRDVAARGTRIVAIDDLADRELPVDLVVNQNLGATDLRYVTRSRTVRLLGPDYVLVRPQFAARRRRQQAIVTQPDGTPTRVLVVLGGTDAAGLISTVSRACLRGFPGASVRAIASAPAGELADDATRSGGHLEMLRPTPDIDAEMAAADFVVTAGGSTVWELCALGAAFGIVVVADNQAAATTRLVEHGAACHLGTIPVTEDALAAALADIAADPRRRREMALSAASLVDGLGTTRVADAIERLQPSGQC